MSRRADNDSIVIKVIVLGSANVGKTALMERYCSNRFSDKRHPTIGSDFRTKILEIHDTEIILQVWDTAGQERFHHGTLGNAFYRGANGAMLVYDVMNPRSIQQLAQWRDEAVSKIDADVYFPIVVVGNKLDLRVDKTSFNKLLSLPNTHRGRNLDDRCGSSSEFEEEYAFGDDTWTETPDTEKEAASILNSNELSLSGDEQEDAECKDSQLTVLQWCKNNSYGHLETSAKEDIGIQTAMQTIAALALEAFKTNPKNEENPKKNMSSNKTVNLNEMYAPKSKSACGNCVG